MADFTATSEEAFSLMHRVSEQRGKGYTAGLRREMESLAKVIDRLSNLLETNAPYP
jgi:hypothetical protein